MLRCPLPTIEPSRDFVTGAWAPGARGNQVGEFSRSALPSSTERRRGRRRRAERRGRACAPEKSFPAPPRALQAYGVRIWGVRRRRHAALGEDVADERRRDVNLELQDRYDGWRAVELQRRSPTTPVTSRSSSATE